MNISKMVFIACLFIQLKLFSLSNHQEDRIEIRRQLHSKGWFWDSMNVARYTYKKQIIHGVESLEKEYKFNFERFITCLYVGSTLGYFGYDKGLFKKIKLLMENQIQKIKNLKSSFKNK